MTVSNFSTNPTKEQKQLQRQAVLDSEVIYEWRCLMRETGKLFQTLGGCGIGLVIMVIFCIASQSMTPLIMFVPALIITTPMMYHLGNVDREYHGQITAKGIIEHRTKIIPDIFYKINRWMGYIGAVTCALAAIFIGSAAFVGAGGFALMALVRGSREKTTETSIMPWDDQKLYQATGPRMKYANSITTYRFLIVEYRRTPLAGRSEVSLTCPEQMYPKIENIIRQYLNVMQLTLEETMAQEGENSTTN
ncbi:hypothetical protein L4C34_04425 [Vibrio profundum]|uniref:hypothetical protein n=1 Tax=Vibrio profundum TaxID=2910247 RepID=UPI003D0FC2BC